MPLTSDDTPVKKISRPSSNASSAPEVLEVDKTDEHGMMAAEVGHRTRIFVDWQDTTVEIDGIVDRIAEKLRRVIGKEVITVCECRVGIGVEHWG